MAAIPKNFRTNRCASVVPPNLLNFQPLCGAQASPCALTPHAASFLLSRSRSDRCSRVLFAPLLCGGLPPSPPRCGRVAALLVSFSAFGSMVFKAIVRLKNMFRFYRPGPHPSMFHVPNILPHCEKKIIVCDKISPPANFFLALSPPP